MRSYIPCASCAVVTDGSVISMSPWTQRQARKLLSDNSPLDEAQKTKMKEELHADPTMGHAKKGSKELKRKKTYKMRDLL